MSDILCPTGDFSSKRIAIELPPIAGLKFASFFGDGTFGSTDGQNLVAGGSTFSNVGSGPTNHSNYSTFAVGTNSLGTGMTDGYPAWTLIAAAAPIGLGGTMLFGYRNSPPPDPGISFFNNQILLQAGLYTFGAGTLIFTGRPVFPAFHLYAIVSAVGKPVTIYDLTTGEHASTANPVSATGSRPGAFEWEIGATAAPTGFSATQTNVAFALGAQSEVLEADLNDVADALRYPLTARGITV